ncbi:MAG: exosortase/archaeosortase family protein [bacterium]|nr:exosortase/archaeosortase family protein [bacterium]
MRSLFRGFFNPFSYMIGEWKERLDSSYTPGPFVPIVVAYMIWAKREKLCSISPMPSKAGLILIIVSLILHFFAQKGDLHRISIFAFVLMVYGMILYFLGKEFFINLVYPVGYLMFMVPMEFLDGMIGVPLRIVASQWAGVILSMLGFHIARAGTQIEMIGIFSFDVAAPCSGLKSLVSLTALGCAFAYITQRQNWKRAVLIIAAIPIAMLANVFRIVFLGLIAVTFGADAALGFFHSFSGFFLFTFALMTLTGLGKLLSWKRSILLS